MVGAAAARRRRNRRRHRRMLRNRLLRRGAADRRRQRGPRRGRQPGQRALGAADRRRRQRREHRHRHRDLHGRAAERPQEPLELRADRGHRLRPLVGVLREHLRDQRREVRRHVRLEAPGARRRHVQVRRDDVAQALADERRAAARHPEEDAAERVDIGSCFGGARLAALLGRHVVRRAHEQAGTGLHARWMGVAGELGEPEVQHLHTLAAGHLRIGDEEQVIGLEIAVRDAGGVRRLQHAGDLAADPAALLVGEPLSLHARGEGSPPSSSITK